MPTGFRPVVLGLGLVAALSFAAQAQTAANPAAPGDSIANLPPDTGTPAAAPPATAPVAPSAALPGPDPGRGWYQSEKQTQAVAPSPTLPGPDPGRGWYAQEKQTGPVQPSPQLDGPKPN
ncbi:MAG TPA: hypothetical protein VJR70_03315 [Stellaceae bacterium]|nr:hypothetical protein [Stellaceae bacterium]